MKLPVAAQKPFELGVLVRGFAEQNLADRKCVERISDHMKYQLEFCEAKELLQMAKALAALPDDAKSTRKLLLARTLGVWTTQRKEELEQAGLGKKTELVLRKI